jgi:hypothetical protein
VKEVASIWRKKESRRGERVKEVASIGRKKESRRGERVKEVASIGRKKEVEMKEGTRATRKDRTKGGRSEG